MHWCNWTPGQPTDSVVVKMKNVILFTILIFLSLLIPGYGVGLGISDPQVVVVGFNYPKTGPYAAEGADQLRGARMALDEINASGGILGHKVLLEVRDSASDIRRTQRNINALLWKKDVKMVFGGVSSAVAIAACAICQEKETPYFGTLTYSTSATAEDAHRFCFRESYNSWMAAKIIAGHLDQHAKGKQYFYISADYTWGWTTEESLRQLTNTTDRERHKGVRTPLGNTNFLDALRVAKAAGADVLVLALFGRDMAYCLRQATVMGLKETSLIVVPNLTLSMARRAGPKAMEGVVGALPWMWQVPFLYQYPKGKTFVEAYKDRYNTYPSSSSASAYAILYEYKQAAERANAFNGVAIVRALEGHRYQWVKDPQAWRHFDHQSIQTVYLVRGNPPHLVKIDPYQLNYFEILGHLPGDQAARTHDQWQTVRKNAGKPPALEKLPGE
jgi:branched-chain amino acid transport system substrate-binding protein